MPQNRNGTYMPEALNQTATKSVEQIGRSGLWVSGQNRTAMRKLPAADPLMAVNGRFRHRSGTAPDHMTKLLPR